MRLGMLNTAGGRRPILVVENGYVDILHHRPDMPNTVIGIIRDWVVCKPTLEALSAQAPDNALAHKDLAAPVSRPGKIFAIGLNYVDHCEETGMPLPEKQLWFTKAVTAVNAPFAPIELPAVSSQLDYEAEMVVVIGRRCRNVPIERANEVVFGYCTGNDVSIRDWQMATTQWSLGKSFDRSAPIGPWITTADAIDENVLDIKSYVNGELRQNSNTRHLVFKVADMVAQLSQAMTLEPGDLIFTGTPSGVGAVWQGTAHFLKAGDITRIEIDGLGAIEAVVEVGTSEPRIL